MSSSRVTRVFKYVALFLPALMNAGCDESKNSKDPPSPYQLVRTYSIDGNTFQLSRDTTNQDLVLVGTRAQGIKIVKPGSGNDSFYLGQYQEPINPGNFVGIGNRLYTAAGRSGLMIAERINDNAYSPLPGVSADRLGAGAVDQILQLSFLEEDYLLIATKLSGLRIYDIANDTAYPIDTDELGPGVVISTMLANGDRVYLGTKAHGVYIFDWSGPRDLEYVGHFKDAKAVTQISVQQQRMHITALDEGLISIDISTATSPQELHRIHLEGASFSMLRKGKFILVSHDIASGRYGLSRIEELPDGTLRRRGSWSVPGKNSQLLLHKNRILVTAGTLGVHEIKVKGF